MCCCGWLLSCCYDCNPDTESINDPDPIKPLIGKGIIKKPPQLMGPRNSSLGFIGISVDSIPAVLEDEEDFIAQYDFIPLLDMDLEAKKGDHIKIIEEESSYSQWCYAKNKESGNVGLIPTTYITKSSSLEKENWYFPDTNCPAAETLLLWHDNECGTFLVRQGRDPEAPFVLSLRTQNSEGKPEVVHYQIRYNDNSYYISDDVARPSLKLLIDYYLNDLNNKLELPCVLRTPCKKIKPLLPNFGPRATNGEIDRREIKTNDDTFIKGGNFAEVHKSEWNNIAVAVKKIRCNDNLDDLIKEIKILRSLKHKNIVRCYGTCTEKQPCLIILEYLPEGDLEDHLQNFQLTTFQKIYIISQIVNGMEYLEKKRVVHRDLAARNILVGDRLTVKIADFGLSRILNINGEYMVRGDVPLPIKWTAYECYNELKYTNKSDVWSFGILLMEIFTDGQKPYAELAKSDRDSLFAALKSGYRMPQPKYCPAKIYEKMLECWSADPAERPNFREIGVFFFTICH